MFTSNAVKCPECGVNFGEEVYECPQCGAEVSPDDKKCPDCEIYFEAEDLADTGSEDGKVLDSVTGSEPAVKVENLDLLDVAIQEGKKKGNHEKSIEEED